MKISGIYQIQSKIKPNRIYIGSSENIYLRWANHSFTLKEKIHRNRILQNHYNKYGSSDLIFSILLGCDKEDLIKVEQYFIDSYNPYFNIHKIAGSPLGCKWKMSDIGRMNISLSHKGKPSHRKGKKHTENAKEKNRLSHLGKKQSAETIKKRTESRTFTMQNKKKDEKTT